MALFALLGVLRGFAPAACEDAGCGVQAYASPQTFGGLTSSPRLRRTRDQDKNCSFLNWTPIVFILDSWMNTNRSGFKTPSNA
jgi:hypothetical protein